MKVKAVIFDLDGVIADTEPLSANADEIVLGRHGIRMTPKEKHEAFGRKVEEIYDDAIKARGLNLDAKLLLEEKDEVFVGLIKGSMKPVKNSLELVGFLKKSGCRVALATSSHEVKMVAELKELGIASLFEVKVNGDEVKRGKPDPEIFMKAAKRLGVKPGECAVIEDSGFGVKAAKRAGMLAIGFRSPNSPGQDLSEADMIVDDLGLVRIYFDKTGLKEAVRVAAISDTHLGLKDRMPEKILKALEGADIILHTGDILDFSVLRHMEKIAPVRAVYGDSDPGSVREELPGLAFTHVFRWKIGMVHSAGYFGTGKALSIAKRHGCDVLVYGHSHWPAIKKRDGVWLINSGSAAMPLLALLVKRTIAILEISQNEIRPKLMKI